MTYTMMTPDPEAIAGIDEALRKWEGINGTAIGFASGDLGWSLRNGAEDATSRLLIVRRGDSTIEAVGFLESESELLLTINPARLFDVGLAEFIVGSVLDHGLSAIATASPPAAIRRALGARGFSVDPEPWVHLWKPLTDADIVPTPGVESTSNDRLIDERVAVQRAAFERSTFTREKWDAMAAGPAFVPGLDLVALNEDGRGVSALTAWLPGPGACGIIEPMGTHRDFRRQGHGLRVLRASFSRLRNLGASGVRVFTPRGNDPAVATYQAAGFRVINLDTTMVRPAP